MERGSRSRRSDVLSTAAAVVAALFLATPALAGSDEKDKEKDKKLKRPALELRWTPRFAFSPARILFTAELKGGDDIEEYYCPEIEWEWGDGGRSVEEADCDPWVTGSTTIERRFTANHVYQYAGLFPVRISLRKTGKLMATQGFNLAVRAGLGDTRGVEPE
jgi:hypothetical protein